MMEPRLAVAIRVVLILLAALFAVARLFVGHREPSLAGSYQALAHLFVGGLLGAWLVDRQQWAWCGWLALGLSAVEVLAFVLGRVL
jgi:hypothetical protein